MNGKYLLDTNAVIALLGGNPALSQLLVNAQWVGISVITELEFLSFPNLSISDQALFQQFRTRVYVLNLDSSDSHLSDKIVSIRRNHKIKLPDAIITASAILHEATLLSNDSQLLKVSGLSLATF